MPYYRPRMLATLSVPLWGKRSRRSAEASSSSAVDLTVRPVRARYTSNDHNHADTLSLECDWTEAGIDPRLLDNAVTTLYMGDADDSGFWMPWDDNCRFIGLAKDIDAERRVGEPGRVRLECVDYTTLFLEAKPFGSSGIPDYGQNLDEAWRRIVSQTPGADVLADRLVFDGVAGVPELGSAVAERFRKAAGRIPTHPETDAWAVWQQTVGMLGLISYIRLDECVVTTARNLYTEADPPVLIWGKNLSSWRENRHSGLAGKGIALISYDPVEGRAVEAFAPPIGDEAVKRKRVKAKKKRGPSDALQREDREYFTFAGITEQSALQALADRIYEERSRQELEGHVTTAEMSVETVSATGFDLLGLRAGDSIQIAIDPRDRELLMALPTDGARMRFLEQRGYSSEVAQLIVENMSEYGTLESKFFVRSVDIELSFDRDSVSFEVSVDYVNRIQLSGDATT